MPPAEFEHTGLWKTTLAPQRSSDRHKAARQALNQAFIDMRERAKPIAAMIAHDLPDFTEHDITHLDALWSLAERIAGKEVKLTPTEAFVLGGAFLVHDLAMGRASYPKGMEELKKEDIWWDTISQILSRRLARAATRDEIEHPDAETEELARSELLRELHARQAQRLPSEPWPGQNGTAFYLIDKPELRKDFGGLIGKLAASHHWNLVEVRRTFEGQASIGAPGPFPAEWTIDPIKLACLLRAADASHLDSRRAPLFLRALRQPTGVSEAHWTFQAKLLQPTVENNRLVFSAVHPGFSYHEAPAWWLCLDTLRVADAELRQIDDLFVSLGRTYRFEARAVEGVNDLEDFARRVRTDGWEPVDTRVHVTDVAGLVRSLGGLALYGDDRYIPLRELIQNGSDAIRARMLLQDAHAGEVTVRLGEDPQGAWIEVEDTGVGMSPNVLKGALLDFGVSFWGSREMRDEHPGLLGKAFEAIGKYGIGFFSVFMWGDRVQVTTRRYDAAFDDTRVLTFDAGLRSRPILRKADKHERLQHGGTRVRIWCHQVPDPGHYHIPDEATRWQKRLAWLCPALDVTLKYQSTHGELLTSVHGGDWVEMNGYELLQRLAEHEGSVAGLPVPTPGERLQLMHDAAGKIVGRALLTPYGSRSESAPAVVVVGGMRTSEVTGAAGIFVARSTSASRKHALPVVSLDVLANWASRQASDLFNVADDYLVDEIAAIAAACGGDLSSYKVRENRAGRTVKRAIREIPTLEALAGEILVTESADTARGPLTYVVSSRFRALLEGTGPRDVWPPLPAGVADGRARLARTPAGALIDAIARNWGADVSEVLQASQFDPEDGRFKQDKDHPLFAHLASWQKQQIGEQIFLIRRP